MQFSVQLGPNTPDWIRTSNLRFRRPMAESHKSNIDKGLRIATQPIGHQLSTDTCQNDPDLAAVVAAWPDVPEAIKAGIVAMVKAASGSED